MSNRKKSYFWIIGVTVSLLLLITAYIWHVLGVKHIIISEVGEISDPRTMAEFALAYAGQEHSNGKSEIARNLPEFRRCVKWLVKNCINNEKSDWIWTHRTGITYGDVSVKGPWISAYTQSLGIEALIASYRIDGNRRDLELSEKAAKVLFRPLQEGGLLFRNKNDIWFEEIPFPSENPPHVLKGHLQTLVTLQKLKEATGKTDYDALLADGLTTLEHWLPLFDNGYGLRHDLSPRKHDILFRFSNPYEFPLTGLAVDTISLGDPKYNSRFTIDVGSPGDLKSEKRIAEGWDEPESLDGRMVRRLKHSSSVTAAGEKNADHKGGSFIMVLPSSEWDNLRSEWLELEIVYKDEKHGNITMQISSSRGGKDFRDLRDGELLLSGSGLWRSWKVPVRVTDLGEQEDSMILQESTLYFEQLAKYHRELTVWVKVIKGYTTMAMNPIIEDRLIRKVTPPVYPSQINSLPVYSLDAHGVVMNHISTKNTEYENGMWWGRGEIGPAIYHPYIISRQAIDGSIFMNTSYYRKCCPPKYKIDMKKIRKEPAFQWFKNNAVRISDDAVVWKFDNESAYTDIVMKPPWASAYIQGCVIKALLTRYDIDDLLRSAAYAYQYTVDKGGLSVFSKENEIFFEEVPNKTHILNAHLSSTIMLHRLGNRLHDEVILELSKQGVFSLNEYMYKYDTGYWSHYDQNPNKEVLFQIDQKSGNRSPAIDEILVQNPQTGTSTRIDVGKKDDFTGYPRITGMEWRDKRYIDGRSVRSFSNGYFLNPAPIPDGTRHNVYFTVVIPEHAFYDYFDVPPHRLIIRYKDEYPGEFVLKTRAINDGAIMNFTPIPGGVLHCTGDKRWKEAIFVLRPQDITWYMGIEYHQGHVELLNELTKITGGWFFSQYAEKWQYYIDKKSKNQPVIVEPEGFNCYKYRDIASRAKVIDSSLMYPEGAVQNALDGDPNNNYVIARETPLPHYFVLFLGKKTTLKRIDLIWESDEFYGEDYTIDVLNDKGTTLKTIARISGGKGKEQIINMPDNTNAEFLRFTVTRCHGQDRMLLRQVRLWEREEISKQSMK